VISTASVMLCLVAGWMLAQMLYLGAVAQDRAQDALYTQFRGELAAGTAPIGPVTEVGAPVSTLSIPRIGVEQVVVEGTASGDLLDGPGHLRNTVLPGQLGTSAVFGRASTYGAPFARIGELARGDRITVTTAQGSKRFTVIGVRRAGDPLPQPRPENAARLVLVSGEASGARLPSLSPGRVVYVDAEAKKAFDTPAGGHDSRRDHRRLAHDRRGHAPVAQPHVMPSPISTTHTKDSHHVCSQALRRREHRSRSGSIAVPRCSGPG